MTGAALIASSFKTLGILASGETGTSDEQDDALLRLNDLIDEWGTQDLLIYVLLRTVKTLAASTASYTIGTGGSINIVRPTEIDHAALILDTSATYPTEIPIGVLTDQEWEAIIQKTYTANYAQSIFYDHGWTAGLGIIYPFPIPNVGTTQLVLYTPQAITAMALSTDYTFPPGYRKLLRYALARDLAPEFGGWSDLKEAIYNESMANVKAKNLRMVDLQFDPALILAGRRSNIYTGEA